MHPSGTNGTHPTWHPRAEFAGARLKLARDGEGPGGAQTSLEGLPAAVISGVPALLDEVRLMLVPVAPEYAEFLIVGRAEVVVAAEAAMAAFVEHAHRCVAPAQRPAGAGLLPDTVLAMFEDVGRNQCEEGFALRTLLSAYQVGGRVAWHHVAVTGLHCGVAADTLVALAEAVFFFVDELCAASTDGYVASQTASVLERERCRDRLVDLLLSDRSDSAAVAVVAAQAGWALPQRAAVVFLPAGDDTDRHVLTRLGPHCLPLHTTGLTGVIVPDADGPGRRARLTTALRGHGAVIGGDVPLDQLPASARLAAAAAELLRTGALSADPVFVEEHLDALIVHHDPHLLNALRQQCLAPLAAAAAWRAS